MRSMKEIRDDLETLDGDLDHYNEGGFLIEELQARRDALAAELEEFFAQYK